MQGTHLSGSPCFACIHVYETPQTSPPEISRSMRVCWTFSEGAQTNVREPITNSRKPHFCKQKSVQWTFYKRSRKLTTNLKHAFLLVTRPPYILGSIPIQGKMDAYSHFTALCSYSKTGFWYQWASIYKYHRLFCFLSIHCK